METSYLMIALRILGSLGLLIYGMKMMSEALQKMAGPQLRHVLGRMTTNRFTGMLTGVLVTVSVQSSTATTVMTVSFVNAGLLTLAQAISVIMGANIGTTLTAWIMSAGFSFNITDFVWPAFLIAMFFIYHDRRTNLGEFIFGLAFMFLGLGTLRQTGTDMNLGENATLLNFFATFDPQSYSTTLLFLLIGGILTMCVQSSAAVMAITMILCSSGALPIYQGIALVMGENIGTTVTSNLAALTASTQARRAAFAHMFFNLFGVFWMLIIFHPFIDFVCSLVGYDVTMTRESVSQEVFLQNASLLSVVLAAFHSCFNVANTAILIWFIPQIERLVCYVIRPKKEEKKETTFRLQYIDSGVMQTPELSVLQAQRETMDFSSRVAEMHKAVGQMIDVRDEAEFQKAFESLHQAEDFADQSEIGIANYLEDVSNDHLSDETKDKVRRMLREISELESLADGCYNLGRILERRMESKLEFPPEQKAAMHQMYDLTSQAVKQMETVLRGNEESDLLESYRLENEINALRDKLMKQNLEDVNQRHYNYAIGTMYADFIKECEHLADYVVNVVQARKGS